ncbi:response regulator [Cohnella rhizosphaerae]|uniref:Response regulator n=1 Tax=Cohnella rhizosphaerae TaxID=1457232 RepID=A0A9X4QV35_9BACL|nr:response regulator [Cohnella rhizosphaerae]MDG0812350.1 response regulator [Cohnella rhizosphaerae]
MERDYSANILVVGDNPAHSLAIEAALDGEPYRYVRASSGIEAVRCLLREEISVILIDVHMSGMSGFEAGGYIKSHGRFEFIPVIFISGAVADADHLATGYSVGAVDYLIRPINPLIFKAKIKVLAGLYGERRSSSLQPREPAGLNRETAQAAAQARAVLDTSIDAMLVLDASGVILEANPAAALMFGYDHGELHGLPRIAAAPFGRAYGRTSEPAVRQADGSGAAPQGRHVLPRRGPLGHGRRRSRIAGLYRSRYYAPQAVGASIARSEGSGRTDFPGEDGIFDLHEPRNPHAPERHYRDAGPASRIRTDVRTGRAGRDRGQ